MAEEGAAGSGGRGGAHGGGMPQARDGLEEWLAEKIARDNRKGIRLLDRAFGLGPTNGVKVDSVDSMMADCADPGESAEDPVRGARERSFMGGLQGGRDGAGGARAAAPAPGDLPVGDLSAGELRGMIEQAVARGLSQGAGAGPSAAGGIEGAIRDSLSELPHVRQVSYTADGGDWSLIVIHDYDGYGEAIREINARLRGVEDEIPGLYIEARIMRVSEAARIDTAGMREIFRRPDHGGSGGKR